MRCTLTPQKHTDLRSGSWLKFVPPLQVVQYAQPFVCLEHLVMGTQHGFSTIAEIL
jgi:hypothetical protein